MMKVITDGGMRTLIFIASVILLVFVSYTTNNIYQTNFNRPFKFYSMALADPEPVSPGKEVTFLSKRTKLRRCQIIADQFVSLIQSDGPDAIKATVGTAVPILQRSVAGGYSNLGTFTIPVKVPIPETAPDGLYTFTQIIKSICDGQVYTDAPPQVHFHVKR